MLVTIPPSRPSVARFDGVASLGVGDCRGLTTLTAPLTIVACVLVEDVTSTRVCLALGTNDVPRGLEVGIEQTTRKLYIWTNAHAQFAASFVGIPLGVPLVCGWSLTSANAQRYLAWNVLTQSLYVDETSSTSLTLTAPLATDRLLVGAYSDTSDLSQLGCYLRGAYRWVAVWSVGLTRAQLLAVAQAGPYRADVPSPLVVWDLTARAGTTCAEQQRQGAPLELRTVWPAAGSSLALAPAAHRGPSTATRWRSGTSGTSVSQTVTACVETRGAVRADRLALLAARGVVTSLRGPLVETRAVVGTSRISLVETRQSGAQTWSGLVETRGRTATSSTGLVETRAGCRVDRLSRTEARQGQSRTTTVPVETRGTTLRAASLWGEARGGLTVVRTASVEARGTTTTPVAQSLVGLTEARGGVTRLTTLAVESRQGLLQLRVLLLEGRGRAVATPLGLTETRGRVTGAAVASTETRAARAVGRGLAVEARAGLEGLWPALVEARSTLLPTTRIVTVSVDVASLRETSCTVAATRELSLDVASTVTRTVDY